MDQAISNRSGIDGCFLNKITKFELLTLIDQWIKNKDKKYCIASINVSKLVMMQKDRKLFDFINTNSINVADGFPVYLATRLIGDPIPERITGIDLMQGLLFLANKEKYSIYFFGAKSETLKLMIDKCRKEYPDLVIAGFRDGYFSKDQEINIVKQISVTKPDMLFIGLGLPQKEYFVSDHISELDTTIILPVGGAFDVYAGLKHRAPGWIQSMGVEWVWRSFYDRTRAMLIIRSFIPFIIIVFKEIFKQRFSGKETT